MFNVEKLAKHISSIIDDYSKSGENRLAHGRSAIDFFKKNNERIIERVFKNKKYTQKIHDEIEFFELFYKLTEWGVENISDLKTADNIMSEEYSNIIKAIYTISVLSFGINAEYLALTIIGNLKNDQYHQYVKIKSPFLEKIKTEALDKWTNRFIQTTGSPLSHEEWGETEADMRQIGREVILGIEKSIKTYLTNNPNQRHSVFFNQRLENLTKLKEFYNFSLETANTNELLRNKLIIKESEYEEIINRIFTTLTIAVGVPMADYFALSLTGRLKDEHLAQMAQMHAKNTPKLIECAVKNIEIAVINITDRKLKLEYGRKI